MTHPATLDRAQFPEQALSDLADIRDFAEWLGLIQLRSCLAVCLEESDPRSQRTLLLQAEAAAIGATEAATMLQAYSYGTHCAALIDALDYIHMRVYRIWLDSLTGKARQ